MPPLPDPYVLVNPKRLEELMQQRNHTYRSLAAAAGVGKTPIHKLVKGEQKRCSYRTASRITAALGVDVEELFQRESDLKVAAS